MTMRVALVVPYLRTPSGWRTASVGAIHALNHYTNVEPVVVVSQADADSARSLLAGYELIELPEIQFMHFRRDDWQTLLSTWWQTRRLRIYPPVNLVHSLEAYPTGLVGHWLAKKQRVPHVMTAIGTYAVKWHGSKYDRLVYKRVLRQAACICPMSSGTLRLMRRFFANALTNKSPVVILLGTDYCDHIPLEVAWQRSPSPVPTILSVGAVKERKGYHISIAAFAKLKEKHPSARYWIIGSVHDHDYYDQLQGLITGDIRKDIEFLGQVSNEELQQRYQQASVFLLTPQEALMKFEGFGLVYLEAGAYGLPVIGSRTGGVPDAVKDNVTGFLVEPDDIDGLVNALSRLLTDTELALRMGRANREWAETLTWERYAQEQLSIYQRFY